jgi:hypothetical protein
LGFGIRSATWISGLALSRFPTFQPRLSHTLNIPFLDGVVNGFFAFLTGKDWPQKIKKDRKEETKRVFCAPLWQECPQKIKIGGLIWLYLLIFTYIWLNSGST